MGTGKGNSEDTWTGKAKAVATDQKNQAKVTSFGIGSVAAYCFIYLMHDLVGWEPAPEAYGQFAILIAAISNHFFSKWGIK